MRIDKLEIYGFGHLRDIQLTFDHGVNVVEGWNEAGKSTLMAFIRAVLFGFEDRRNPELRYEPVEGGKFGGVLYVTDENNSSYRIERVYRRKVAGDVTVYLPDGGEAGEEALNQLLGRMNKKVFKQIFAFGLGELQQLESLREDEINHFIYTAGTGDGQTILRAQKQLDDREQSLFKPGGSKGEINVLLQQIRDTHSELSQLKKENAEYNRLILELDKLDRQVELAEQSLEEMRTKVSWQEKLVQQYEAYEKYIEVEDRLRITPDIEEFPQDGVTRLDNLEHSIQQKKAELADLKERLNQTDQEYQQIDMNQDILNHQPEIEYLKDDLNKYRDYKDQISRQQAELKQKQDRLDELLSQLGPGWTEEQVKAFDHSFSTKQTVRQYSQKLHNLEDDLKVAKTRMEDSQRLADKQQKQLEVIKSREPLLSFSSSMDDKVNTSAYDLINQEQEDLRKARQYLLQRQQQENEITSTEEQLKQHQELKQMLINSSQTGNQSNRMWKWILAGATLAVPILLYLIYESFIFAGAGFLVMLVLSVREFLTAKSKSQASLPHDWEKKQQVLDQRHTQLKEDYQSTEQHLASLLERYNREIQPNDETINQWEKELEQKKEQFRQYKDWQEQLKQKEMDIKQSQDDLEELKASCGVITDEYESTRQKWKQWLQSRGMITGKKESNEMTDLNPEMVQEMIRNVESCKELIHLLDNIRLDMDKNRQFISDYLEKVKSITDACKITEYTEDPEYMVMQLIKLLEKNKELLLQKKRLKEKINELEESYSKKEHQWKAEEEQMDYLLSAGATENAEDFRRRAAQYREQTEWKKEKEAILQSFRRLTEDDEELNRFIQELGQTSHSEVQEQLKQLREQLNQSNSSYKELLEQRTTLLNHINRLASGQDLSDKNHRYHVLVSQMQQYAREWAVTVMTKHVMQKAMEIYEREKQPGVLKKASYYLQTITGGRYVRVIAPLGENKIEVEREDGRRLEPAYLSRGTVEQLYLAMRFALVEEYGKKVLLPMVMDDIFVNFDPQRMKQAVRAIQNVADQRQILFFTCHPHISQLFNEEKVSHHNIRLQP